MRPVWGPGPKPTVTTLYQLVAKESYHYGKAQSKALPGYGSAYYVEDAIHRWAGVEHAFGKYSVTRAHENLESRAAQHYRSVSSNVNTVDPARVNYLSPVRQAESGRASSLSYQQSATRPGTSSKTKAVMVKPTWKSGGKGGKWRPSCPSGHKLRRVGKRLMCVKSS